MHHVESGADDRLLEQRESDILAVISKSKTQFFGNEEVAVDSKSPLGEKVNEYVSALLNNFPCSANGSQFVHSTFTATPELVIRYADLQPILQPEREGSLFSKELGKAFEVKPLKNSLCGTFTHESTRLELVDLRLAKNSKLIGNEWTQAKVLRESRLAVVQRAKTIGEVDIDPNLKKIRLIATVRFGTHIAKDQEIVGETRNGTTVDLIVPLEHLSLSAKISPDGLVKLENEASFSIEQLIGDEPVTWIDVAHKLNLQFDLRHKG